MLLCLAPNVAGVVVDQVMPALQCRDLERVTTRCTVNLPAVDFYVL
jgi:hypothetical protein